MPSTIYCGAVRIDSPAAAIPRGPFAIGRPRAGQGCTMHRRDPDPGNRPGVACSRLPVRGTRDLKPGSRVRGRPNEGVGAMTQATEEPVLHILWMNGGLGCDGDSVALTAATQPSIEEIVLGALPGLPKVAVHWPLIDFECGPEQGADNFIEWWHKADRGELDPFVLVVEGSIPNEDIKSEGYWCGFGNNPATGQPMTTNEWLDRLGPKATPILAPGTCATYSGGPAQGGRPPGPGGPPWTKRSGRGGSTAPRSTKGATGAAITSRASSPANTVRPSAWSSWAAGGPSSSATCRSAAGSTGSAAAPTWAGSASPAPCPASRTSSCRSWTSRLGRRCR